MQHIQMASLQAFWAATLIERRDLQEARAELDSVQRQMRLQDDLSRPFHMNFGFALVD